jgi:hypothetical protein
MSLCRYESIGATCIIPAVTLDYSMNRNVMVASGVVVVVALFAILWGSTYSVPDLVQVSYGLPLNWGVNLLDTIAGPVDKWSVDLVALAINLVFWFATLLVVQFIVSRRG